MNGRAAATVAELSDQELFRLLRAGAHAIDYGAARVRVQAASAGFARQFRAVYGAFTLRPEAFADFHVRVVAGGGLRRVLRPQVRFRIDGVEPFDPFPAANALPMFEWGVNWCFGQRFNQYVLLHAGVLALDGRAVLMAAVPGSGKSTLAAAMMLRGFRLLSDEFGVLCPRSGELLPMLKPVALKNRSIELIRAWSAAAVIGPVFRGTRKGDVAHLAPDAASVGAAAHAARPALLLFPAFREGEGVTLTALSGEHAFARLAFNSFNYGLLGRAGFDAVGDVVERCPAFELRYDRLEAAIDRIRELLHDRGA